MARRDPAARSGVPYQPDGGPPGPGSRVRSQHQRLADLIGGHDCRRDREHYPPDPAPADRAVPPNDRHMANDTCSDAKMGRMKPAKHSVAVVVRDGGGRFLAVRRPDDPEDPLAGLWGLPAITLRDGEDEQAAVVRAGRAKLGVELAAGPKIGGQTADRGAYLLHLSDYEATIV